MDLALMDERDLTELLPFIESAMVQEQVRWRAKSAGLNFSLRHHDQLIACGGIGLLWPGVGEAWFWGTPHKTRHPIALYKATRQWLDRSMPLLRLHRVEAIIRQDFAEGHRFAQALGFTAEGIRRQFGPDRMDFTMYARVTQKEDITDG